MNSNINNNNNVSIQSPLKNQGFKINGFSSPYPWQQILTWIFLMVNTILFCSFNLTLCYKNNSTSFFIGVLSIFIFLTILVIIFGFISTFIDPSDSLFKKELLKKNECLEQNKKYVLEISKIEPFCIICCSNINNNSKHCKKCNKCVEFFDHHCNWLNNCIGKPNYYYFYFLLLILIINLYFNTCISVICVFSKKNKKQDSFDSIISIILSIGDLILGCNLTYLFIVHSWLRYKGITTYEYILSKLDKENSQNNSNVSQKMENNNKSDEHHLYSNNIKMNSYLGMEDRNNNSSSLGEKMKHGKNRNKFLPKDLIEKLDEYQKNSTYTASQVNTVIGNNNDKNNHDKNKSCIFKFEDEKIIIEGDNVKEEIFQPIVDKIYHSSNTNLHSMKSNRMTSEIRRRASSQNKSSDKNSLQSEFGKIG